MAIVTFLSPDELKRHQIDQYEHRIKETVCPIAKAWLKNQLNKLNGTTDYILANRGNAALSRLFLNHNANKK